MEVHVGDKLPAPACAYQCKTNGGETLVLNPKDIGKYVCVRDRGARRVCGAFWHSFVVWNLAQWVTETMQPPNGVENEPTSLANTTH